MIKIPQQFLDIPYNSSIYPGSKDSTNLEKGANCQVYAYTILRYFGYSIPDFRSSELWEDYEYSEQVYDLEPFDILFWNKTRNSYGAHIGIYI